MMSGGVAVNGAELGVVGDCQGVDATWACSEQASVGSIAWIEGWAGPAAEWDAVRLHWL